MYNGLLARESLTAEDGVKYFWNTLGHHFINVAKSVFSSGDFIIHSSKERKQGDDQEDRQVLTAPEASTRCLDGLVAGVLHERTSDRTRKVISIQCSLLQAISENPRENDLRVFFLSREWMSLLTPLKQ